MILPFDVFIMLRMDLNYIHNVSGILVEGIFFSLVHCYVNDFDLVKEHILCVAGDLAV